MIAGGRARRWWRGPFSGCGVCAYCAGGRADHCTQFQLIGLERPGGFAEFVTVRADELFALPASVLADEQPLVEPLAIVRRAFRRAGVVRSDRVAVLGAGPIGLGRGGVGRGHGRRSRGRERTVGSPSRSGHSPRGRRRLRPP